MSDANTAALRRIYDEVFNEGVVAADAVDHSPPPNATGDTREDLKGFATLIRQAFPDVHFTVLQEIAHGDKVVMTYEMTGTHEGEFVGMPPSGEKVTVKGVDIVTVANGKCTEHWGWDDSWQLMMAGGPPTG